MLFDMYDVMSSMRLLMLFGVALSAAQLVLIFKINSKLSQLIERKGSKE